MLLLGGEEPLNAVPRQSYVCYSIDMGAMSMNQLFG